eukprot:scaffold283878_cov41-Prasinocladus_malaysianus.AAC.1
MEPLLSTIQNLAAVLRLLCSNASARPTGGLPQACATSARGGGGVGPPSGTPNTGAPTAGAEGEGVQAMLSLYPAAPTIRQDDYFGCACRS